jgi:hypothetical protein
MTPPTGQKAKMLAGELYLATDPQLVGPARAGLLFRFNIERLTGVKWPTTAESRDPVTFAAGREAQTS